jgi:hypothetical protein
MPRNLSFRAANARRVRIAEEAARILMEEGVTDYGSAKRKAALRIGEKSHGQHLPSNQEIESVLSRRQRLYAPGEMEGRVQRMREAAWRFMALLEPLEMRLAGGALTSVGPNAMEVDLHVFADAPEIVAFRLLEAGIDYRLAERRLRFKGGEGVFPVYRVEQESPPIHLTVFDADDIRQAPLSPIDGRPMRRVGRHELGRLLRRSIVDGIPGEFQDFPER